MLLSIAICLVVASIWGLVANDTPVEFMGRIVFMVGMQIIWYYVFH